MALRSSSFSKLRGLADFGEDRPLLRLNADLPTWEDQGTTAPLMLMLGREQAGEALPLNAVYGSTFAVLLGLAMISGAVALHGIEVDALGERAFSVNISSCLCNASDRRRQHTGLAGVERTASSARPLVYLDRSPPGAVRPGP